MRKQITTLLLLLLTITVSAQTKLPYQDESLSAIERARDLCSRLTLEEKASLMQDLSPAIPRLGIPEFPWWSEALHGVGRNGYVTVFPATIGMAASFDDNLLYRIFDAVSDEARAKNNEARHSGRIKRYQGLSFWTPNINIFRDPRWGRGQETYGEDPYLTTMMGLAVVRGLQGPDSTKYRKLLACAKHFAVHSGPEWNRHSFNLENISARDLWETYLPAFEALVKDGHVAEVMCAYQRIDGEPCCSNSHYEQQILRNDWHFDGLITSDCGAISDFWMKGRHGTAKDAAQASAQAVRTGTDLECGSNYKNLPEAVKAGEITEAEIDTSLIRLLRARFELGDFATEDDNPWMRIPSSVIASKEHKALALQMANESMVLLQNRDNLLPLKKEAKGIVVMGPNANDSIMQWANYSGVATETSTVLKAVRQKLGGVRYVRGCNYTNFQTDESLWNGISHNGRKGMKATYWNNTKMSGTPAASAWFSAPVNLSNGGATVFAPGVNLEDMSATFEGTFVPSKTETVTFKAAFDDGARLIVNGEVVSDVWKGRSRVQYINKDMQVEKGKKYEIRLEFFQSKDMGIVQFDIVHKATSTVQDVVAQVKDAQTVIFVGGISPQLEGEEMKVSEPGFKGGDRTDIELPLAQRDLIKALHDAGKKIVFVNCSGSAIAMEPETKNCDAILQAWYPGERGGEAVANVLFGDYNPSGKLPITFYRHTSDLPDFLDYNMKNRTYRYYEGNALFPFGYGLSYTSFSIKPTEIKNNKLQVTVTNTGDKAGIEIVQMYIKNLSDAEGPLKTLRGFQRVSLQPNESKTIEFDCIDKKTLQTFDPTTNTMRFTGGKYNIYVGSSSREADLKTLSITVNPKL